MGLLLLFDWTALTNNIDLGTKPTWNSLAFSLPIAMIGFTGLEKVTGLVGPGQAAREVACPTAFARRCSR